MGRRIVFGVMTGAIVVWLIALIRAIVRHDKHNLTYLMIAGVMLLGVCVAQFFGKRRT